MGAKFALTICVYNCASMLNQIYSERLINVVVIWKKPSSSSMVITAREAEGEGGGGGG